MELLALILMIVLPLIASIICGTIGYFVGNTFGYWFTGTFAGAALAFGTYLAYEIEIANEKESKVLQLLGKFSRCLNKDGKSAGVYLVAKPFEKIFKIVPVEQDFPLELYRDPKEGNEVTFTDCSSPISARAWLRVHDPVKYAYEVKDPENYAENYVDSTIRPRFGGRTLDKANTDKSDIATECLPLINNGFDERVGILEKAGVEMTQLFIEDFRLPDEVKKIRDDLLQGETDAKRYRAKFDGVIDAIANVAKGLVTQGMSEEKAIEKAADIFFEQTGMETVKEAKENITFITENVKSMLRVFSPASSPKGGK